MKTGKKDKTPRVTAFDKGVVDFSRFSQGSGFNKFKNSFSVKKDFTGFRRGSR